jgi:hypothetical protein
LGTIQVNTYLYFECFVRLSQIQAQLEMYYQHHQISPMLDDVTSELELGMALPSNGLSLFNHTTPQHYNVVLVAALPVSQQQSYSNGSIGVYTSSYMDVKYINVAKSFWVQKTNYEKNINNSMVIQSWLVVSQLQTIQQEVVQDYDELQLFFIPSTTNNHTLIPKRLMS